MILQSYTGNQIDFCACTALCNVLLIMSCCCWSGECGRGGFSGVLATSCAQDKKWSSGLHTLKIAPQKNLTPWPGIMNGKNLGLVLQIRFLMKKNAKSLLVSETSICFPDSRIKRQNVWGRATFLALICLFTSSLLYSWRVKRWQELRTKPMKLTMFCGICILCRHLHTSIMGSAACIYVLLGTYMLSLFPQFPELKCWGKKLLATNKLNFHWVWISQYIQNTITHCILCVFWNF